MGNILCVNVAENLLGLFGFVKSSEVNNVFYRSAENENYDVVKYVQDENLYNVCVKDGVYDFINEKQLREILK